MTGRQRWYPKPPCPVIDAQVPRRVDPSFAASSFVLPTVICHGYTRMSVDQVTVSRGSRIDACDGRVVGDQCRGIPTVDIQDRQPTAPREQGEAAMLKMVVGFRVTDRNVWPIRVAKHSLNDGLVHGVPTVGKHPVGAGQPGRLERASQPCGTSHCYTDPVTRRPMPTANSSRSFSILSSHLPNARLSKRNGAPSPSFT